MTYFSQSVCRNAKYRQSGNEARGFDKRAAKDIAGDRWGMGFAVMRHARTLPPTRTHTSRTTVFALHLGCGTRARGARRRISTSSLRSANWKARQTGVISHRKEKNKNSLLFFLLNGPILWYKHKKWMRGKSVCKSGSRSPLRILHWKSPESGSGHDSSGNLFCPLIYTKGY